MMVQHDLIRLVCLSGVALALLVAPLRAQEEKYPSRPVQLVLSFPPGGALDVAVRILEPRLSAALGVPLVIMSRAGAGGGLAINTVIKSPPDGYTVLATFNTAINLVRLTNKDVTYSYRDLIPIGNFAVDVGAIVVHQDARWTSFAALFDEAKQNPGKLTYGSAGVGSVSALMLDAVKLQRGVDLVHVPFAGTPPANVAVLGKQVDFGTVAFSPTIPLVKDGKMRVLAVSFDQAPAVISGHSHARGARHPQRQPVAQGRALCSSRHSAAHCRNVVEGLHGRSARSLDGQAT